MPLATKIKPPTSVPASDGTLWAAAVARDKSYDGKVYYAVATTGIYCRPGCPARLPKRANVRFYASCAEAHAAGFRACKRCKPDQPSLEKQYAAKVAQACRHIETAQDPPKLVELATAAGLSPFHFHRIFKMIAGVTPKAYADAHRHKRVRATLTRSASITQAIFDAGFNCNGRFYAASSHVLGMTPTEFKSGGANSAIEFTIGQCSLGCILIAASATGLCAVLMGNDADGLLQALHDRFPRAQISSARRSFKKLSNQVIAQVERPGSAIDLPLDVRGTAFQHQVWQALRGIPSGATVSYAELAARIGKPKAVRAVASACAANPIAVLIPCHRVVGTNGALSGYRWGVERKRALLAREAKSKAKKP